MYLLLLYNTIILKYDIYLLFKNNLSSSTIATNAS